MIIKEPLKNTHTFMVNGVVITTKSLKDAINVYKYKFGEKKIESVSMDGEEIEKQDNENEY